MNRQTRSILVRVCAAFGVLGSSGVLVSCAGHRHPAAAEPLGAASTLVFDAGDYPDVFDAAMDALTELRFTPDRIDARRGVITTYPKTTAGLASPWDREQSSLGDEGRDLLHQHERVCRIVFEPADAPTSVVVEVTILRVRRPGWRVETDAISFSSHAVDPAALRAGDEPEYRDPIGADSALAARLAHAIAERAPASTP